MTLQLLIRGSTKTLHVECEGQVELPGSPPFLTSPAIVITLELGSTSENLSRLFDAWYMKEWTVPVLAWDGGPAVTAIARCVEMDWQRGLQVTRAWSEPLRHASVNGQCLLYRPTPRHQQIRGMTNKYVLTADRWEQAAVPEEFRRRSGLVEVWQ